MELKEYDKIIIGIDPGTNVMGYGILGIRERRPSMIAMGIIKLNAFESHYLRLRRIHERVTSLIDQYLPDEMAIEAPFFGKNVQSMLKLGRAQGSAMVAALMRDIPITEYEPRKIKLAITGTGAASKEQVQTLVANILSIPHDQLLPQLDATDALAAALCHHYETSSPLSPANLPHTSKGAVRIPASKQTSGSWASFIAQNPSRIKR